MRGFLRSVGWACLWLAILSLAYCSISWRWGECKKVGHSDLYCFYDMGRK